jgi:hypothetical protein
MAGTSEFGRPFRARTNQVVTTAAALDIAGLAKYDD